VALLLFGCWGIYGFAVIWLLGNLRLCRHAVRSGSWSLKNEYRKKAVIGHL
jgi:hypothetical protein